jgi:hypothetical protein
VNEFPQVNEDVTLLLKAQELRAMAEIGGEPHSGLAGGHVVLQSPRDDSG